MADVDDIALLESGEKDLHGCDFSKYNAEGRNFSNIDFSGCNLNEANFSGSVFRDCNFVGVSIFKINFHRAVLSECKFQSSIFLANFDEATIEGGEIAGLIQKTSFKGTKFNNVQLKQLKFGEGNEFDDLSSSFGTDFSGIEMPRSLSKSNFFKDYTFSLGKLVRNHENSHEFTPDEEKAKEEKRSLASLEVSLRSHPEGVKLMCLSLSKEIDNFIEKTPVPNDPERLEYYQSYISLLDLIRIHLDKISDALEVDNSAIRPENIESAKRSILSLRSVMQNWWQDNAEETFKYGATVGILGAGTAFLVLCGAPTLMATGICAALSGSKSVTDYLKDAKS